MRVRADFHDRRSLSSDLGPPRPSRSRARASLACASAVAVAVGVFAYRGTSHDQLLRMAEDFHLVARQPNSVALKGCGLVVHTDPARLRSRRVRLYLRDDKSLFERIDAGSSDGAAITCVRQPLRPVDRIQRSWSTFLEGNRAGVETSTEYSLNVEGYNTQNYHSIKRYSLI